MVASVATGSIEQGQDATYPGSQTGSQRSRSGVAQEAAFYYYAWSGCGNVKALETAVTDGVDVFNMSHGSGDCDRSQNPCNFNAAAINATNAGIVLVASSGNDIPTASDGYCSVNHPAVRTVVMSVGALSSSNSTVDYEDVVRSTFFAYGDKLVDMYNTSAKLAPMVDLIAPAFVEGYFTATANSGSNAYSILDCFGTSYAAPQVSAIAGLMREWQSGFGWSLADDARAIFANTILLGDRYNGSQTYPSSEASTYVPDTVGSGRVRAHWPHSASMGSPYSWASYKRTIDDDEVMYLAIPGNPQSSAKAGVKANLVWFDGDIYNIADLKFQIVDLDLAGEYVVATAGAGALRKQLQLQTTSQYAGRNLYLKITGSSVPSSGETFYATAYTYSNSDVLH